VSGLRITPGDFANDQVRALLTLHVSEARANSPPGHSFALDFSGLQKPEISFFTAWSGDELAGMGALKELSATRGEIKSMRTAPAFLRRGVAAEMLEHLIETARSRRYQRISLETGAGPAYEAALSLYRKRGFQPGAAFADYAPSDFNQFFHLDLP
jgi:putative acetyltransferase